MKPNKCRTILIFFTYLVHKCIVVYGFTQFEDSIKYAIKENQPGQMRIGKISEDVSLPTQLILKNLSDKISYRLQRSLSFFELDPKTSILKSKTLIDLEELCPMHCPTGEMGQLNLVVNVWNSLNLKGIIKVEINIQDVNDNNPTFLTSSILKSVKEVIYGVGKSVELQKAIDRDVSKEHNSVMYELDADKHNDTFILKVTNDSFPILVIKKALDYERCKIYHLAIWAWNNPAPNKKTKLSVTIRVVNINDMEPKFKQQKYEVSIGENLPINSMIVQVEAVDEDEDSEITYRSTDFSSQFFTVSTKGQIFLIKQLDFEITSQHLIDVQATDNEFIANTKVIITVLDYNDEMPQFNLNPSVCRIEEGQPENLIIGQITISDRDSAAANGKLACWEPRHLYNKQAVIFKPPLDSKIFYGKYDLHTRVVFDREETDEDFRRVIIICHDGAEKNPLTSTMTINVTISDINDNAPVFVKPIFAANIEENNGENVKVIRINSTDKDIGMNGKVSYEIDNLRSMTADKMLFVIDPESGWITVTHSLDREKESFYQLMIIAKDNGTVPKQQSSSCLVNITVSDVNDNTPKFIGNNKLSILENQPPGTLIENLRAIDLDEGDNGQLVFNLLPNHNENYFHLNANGSLKSAKVFDREILERYCLQIEINDKGKPPRSITNTVCINIVDVNDNSPRLFFPDNEPIYTSTNNSLLQKEIISLDLSLYEQAGFEIIKCEATDGDEGENAQFQFRIKINKDPDLFSIDSLNGNLRLKRKLNRDSLGDHNIQIIVEDNGKPSRNHSQKIVVKIQDIPRLEERLRKPILSHWTRSGKFQFAIMISIASAVLMLIFISTVLYIIKPCANHPPNRGDYSSVGRQFLCDTKSSNLEMKNEQYLYPTNLNHDKMTHYIPNIYQYDPVVEPQSITPNPLHNVMYPATYTNSHYNQFYLPRSYPFNSENKDLKSTFSPIYENSSFQKFNSIPRQS